jgi:RNA polymerase sigma-70 factor (ECF subfamily)
MARDAATAAGAASGLTASHLRVDPRRWWEHLMSYELRSATTTQPAGAPFEEVVLPHLDAGYRLARWMMRNEHDAEDVVQEACLRALRYFRTFVGGDGRAWFLRIVRTACLDACGCRNESLTDPFDEERHPTADPTANPEVMLVRIDESALVARALRSLPERFRELLVLRELEGLSYRELADVIGVPIGTIMSGLSRARRALRTAIVNERRQSRASTAAALDHECEAIAV